MVPSAKSFCRHAIFLFLCRADGAAAAAAPPANPLIEVDFELLPPGSCLHNDECSLQTPPRLILDPPTPAGSVQRFRTTADALPESSPFSPQGLPALRASGSSQFSLEGLGAVVRGLTERQLTTPAHLTVIDLRNEPHVILPTQAVSWHAWNNWLNKDLSPEAAQADELQRLATLQGTSSVQAYTLCKEKSPTGLRLFYQNAEPLRGPPMLEAKTVAQMGLHYMRLPMADHTGAPTPEVVQRFIDALKQRPAEHWWHFHCRQGMGRTTMFMAMLDMWHNAAQVPLIDIAARQEALGGINILAKNPLNPTKSAARRAFAAAFYDYCRQGAPGSWRTWLARAY